MKSITRAAALGVCALGLNSAYGEPLLRTVALMGDQAPGAPAGALFRSESSGTGTFSAPVLNNLGQVAFAAAMEEGLGGVTLADNRGIWSEGNGILNLAVREGDQAPGASLGVKFGNLFGVGGLTDSGKLAFGALLQQGGEVAANNDSGVWLGGTAPTSLIAREGAEAPGTSAGARFGSFANLANFPYTADAFMNPIGFNRLGEIAFSNSLQAGNGVAPTNDAGIWRQGPTLSLVAREGDPAAGFPASELFSQELTVGSLTSSGQVAFSARTAPGASSGIWTGGSTSLTLVANAGASAPGATPGAVFAAMTSQIPSVNSAGQIAFVAPLAVGPGGVTSNNDAAIWAAGGGSLSLLAREGDQVPNSPSGTVFNSFSSPQINSSGHTAFIGLTRTAPLDISSGLWVSKNGQLTNVAQVGDVFEGVTLYGIESFVLNSSGQVAFLGSIEIRGGKKGLFAQDAAGEVRLIASEGGLLEVAPGDSRTIFQLYFDSSASGDDAIGSGFNDQGHVAFAAAFGSPQGSGPYTAGLFVSSVAAVPEPSTVLLAVVGCSSLIAVRRRR